jgi:hypothetical protein
MRDRVGPEAPAVGEMFDYVIVGAGIRDIRYIDLMRFEEAHTIHDINVEYYFTRAIVSPLEEPLAAVYGAQDTRAILDQTRYVIVKRLGAQPGNLFYTWNLPALTVTIGPTRESHRTPGLPDTKATTFRPPAASQETKGSRSAVQLRSNVLCRPSIMGWAVPMHLAWNK